MVVLILVVVLMPLSFLLLLHLSFFSHSVLPCILHLIIVAWTSISSVLTLSLRWNSFLPVEYNNGNILSLSRDRPHGLALSPTFTPSFSYSLLSRVLAVALSQPGQFVLLSSRLSLAVAIRISITS